MIIRPVIKSKEQFDMSLSQCKQIREHFLVQSRTYLLETETRNDRCAIPASGRIASPLGASPCCGTFAN